jgi:hypothetical protein
MLRRVAALFGCPKLQYRAFVFMPMPMERLACPLPSQLSHYVAPVRAQSKNTKIPAAHCICQNVLHPYHDFWCKP